MIEENIIRNLDVTNIQEYQQNRYPCLFIDYVNELVPGKNAKGFKNFSFNEWFFPCHFPDEPNVPGFIQIEALTQMFLMTFLSIPENKGKKTSFISVNNAKFKKKIIPGNRLDIVSELKSYRRGIAIGESIGYIDGEIACSSEFVVAIPDVLNQFNPSLKK
jgi:3-hydroxyacyl-[acyl-carrier-protein] dehydratase